eukprot:9469160-Pyramimonas_sp.AAC.1
MVRSFAALCKIFFAALFFLLLEYVTRAANRFDMLSQNVLELTTTAMLSTGTDEIVMLTFSEALSKMSALLVKYSSVGSAPNKVFARSAKDSTEEKHPGGTTTAS